MATPQRSSRCCGCSGEFFWPASATQPNNLFPLLCGEVYCRSCLALKAREVLSTKVVPLRCCEKVVPHDFVREVLDPEEDVYYSFLVKPPLSGVNKADASTFVVSVLPTTATPGMNTTANARAQRATARSARAALVNSATQPPRSRYLTRSSKALVTEQDSKPSRGTTTAIPGAVKQKTAPSAARTQCLMCGVRVSDSLFKAPCGHRLCLKCVEADVRRYLATDTKDNSVPANCCHEVLPLDLVQRVISGKERTTYAKRMVKYVDATKEPTTANARGTKRKTAPEKKPAASARVTRGSKGKAPAKRAKNVVDLTQEDERVCVACYSDVTFENLRIVPCGHGYCGSCLAKMAKASLTDRNQVPISCCSKEFPMDYVEKTLTKAQFAQYQRYLTERNHKNSTLKSDRDYTAVVRKNHGKQCPSCGIGVMKISGCNAISCPLGHYFCWKCLQTKCTCGQIYGYH